MALRIRKFKIFFFFFTALVLTNTAFRMAVLVKNDARRATHQSTTDSINSVIKSGISLRNTPYQEKIYIRYAADRLGLLPLPNVKPLRPEFGPVFNDVTSYRYPITIPSCRDEVNGKRNIFIAVISATDNFEKRAIIRQTWTTDLNAWNRSLTGLAGFAFIMGRTENGSTQKRIEEENAVHKDIIQIDMIDVYRNLPIKITGLLSWMNRNCANFKGFLFKVDDDLYVNVRALNNFIHSYDPFILKIYGTKYLNPFPPTRDPNFNSFITLEEWPFVNYPKFLTGGANIFTHETIIPLLAAVQTTPMMPFEDVYLTGICAEKAQVPTFCPYQQNYGQSGPRFIIYHQEGLPYAWRIPTIVTWATDPSKSMMQSHLETQKFYHDL